MSFKSDAASVQRAFESSGGVIDVRIAKDQDGYSRGFGHVDFDTPENAAKALSLAGTAVDGREIRCDLSQPRANAPPGGGGRGRSSRVQHM